MFRSLILLCFLCLFSSLATAQHRKFRWPKRPSERKPPVVIPPKPGLVINSNLFSLTEPDGGPSLGFEYRASLHWAVMVEGTLLLYTLGQQGADNGSGFRIQPELRYYFPGKHRTLRGFFGVQATYKEKSYRDSARVGTGIRDPNSERVYFPAKKQILAGAAIIGVQQRFGKAKHFMVEAYAGLGLKQKDYYGRPANIIYEKSLFIPDIDRPGSYPHIAMGIRLGYCF